MNLRKLLRGEAIPFDLLLLADPSRQMIDGYILDSMIYIAEDDNQNVVGICVLYPISGDLAEIKNLAVSESYQRCGIGTELLQYAEEMARQAGYKRLQIGTANNGFVQLELYQKMGFDMVSIKHNFFIDNYEETLFENGLQCKHMIMLVKNIC